MLNHSCPIDLHSVDEHIARLNALFTLTLLLAGYYFSFLFWLFLLTDFTLRATKKVRFSPIAKTSLFILNTLHIHPKPVDRAPKLFATRIGLTMNILLLAFFLLNLLSLWQLTLAFFVFAVSLEAFFAYCLGCQIYSLLINLHIIKR